MLTIYQHACVEKLRAETANLPDWQDFDESGSADGGASTRPISSVGTPQPGPRSGFKLKLNGARGADGGGSGQGPGPGTESAAVSDEE